jgi:hypothetical protein
VAIEPLEVEGSRTESKDPAREGTSGNADAARDARQRDSVGEHLADRIQDHLDARDFARQRIARQHALAVSAAVTSCQRHCERHERVGSLEPSLDATASKSDIVSVACGAPTADEELVATAVDDRCVLARLDVEYEDHVLVTAPG